MITYFYNINTNEEVYALPTKWIYQNSTVLGLTEANMSHFGWEKRTREIEVPEPPTIDRTNFDTACEKFRTICTAIGQLIDEPDFKGGFDEMTEFESSENATTPEGIAMALQWLACDKLCTYEAMKIGLGQPEWWYECWQSEN